MDPVLIKILMAILQALLSIFGSKSNAMEALQTGSLLGVWRRRWVRGMVAAYAWQHANNQTEADDLTNKVMAELLRPGSGSLEYVWTLIPPK